MSAIAHLQKALITASSENVTDSQSSAYMRKHNLFTQNVLSLHMRKNITESWSKPLQKCWTGVKFGCKIWAFIMILRTKTIIFFLFQRLLSKKYDNVKKHLC